MIRELLQYLHLAEDLFYHTDTNFGIPAYNTVLQSLVEAGEVSSFHTIVYILIITSWGGCLICDICL